MARFPVRGGWFPMSLAGRGHGFEDVGDRHSAAVPHRVPLRELVAPAGLRCVVPVAESDSSGRPGGADRFARDREHFS